MEMPYWNIFSIQMPHYIWTFDINMWYQECPMKKIELNSWKSTEFRCCFKMLYATALVLIESNINRLIDRHCRITFFYISIKLCAARSLLLLVLMLRKFYLWTNKIILNNVIIQKTSGIFFACPHFICT